MIAPRPALYGGVAAAVLLAGVAGFAVAKLAFSNDKPAETAAPKKAEEADSGGHQGAVVMAATVIQASGIGVEAVKDEERVVLGESTAGLAEEYPDLEVERTLAEADPSSALLAAAALARLLVVGSHGRGGVARMLLGSVSHAMVLHSPCPVLVVRGNRKEKDDEH